MRLTNTDRYGHFYTNKANCRNVWSKDGKKLEGEFFANQTLAIDGNAIDKLGKLEDIEDELGIDLITLFKALKNGIYISNERADKNEKYDIEDLWIGYSNGNRKSYELTWETWGGHSSGETYFPYKRSVSTKDYGKTWALTKEELL